MLCFLGFFREENMMRQSTLRILTISAATVALVGTACSVTVKTQTKYVGDPVTKTAPSTFNNQAIQIDNQNGDVIIQGVPNLTQVSVTTKPFAFADVQADGNGAIQQVVSSIVISETGGKYFIHCSKASSNVGSANTSTTGCDG